MTAPTLIGSSGDSLREAFGRALVHCATTHSFCVFDADVAGGTGVHHYRKAFPRRFYQCGIAEQNMMSVAAGFSLETGMPAVVTTFAVFCLRAFEQARLSIAYAGANVKIVASHPGLEVGPDGASAQCLEDLAAFRSLPGMTVLSPCDPSQMERAVPAILAQQGPLYMRTGRSPAVRFLQNQPFQIGKGLLLQDGAAVTLVACGSISHEALLATRELRARGVDAALLLMPTLKPLDEDLLLHQARRGSHFVTVEDHSIIGGLGSAIAEFLAECHPARVLRIGVKDRFGSSGEAEELRAAYGLNAPSIVAAAFATLVI